MVGRRGDPTLASLAEVGCGGRSTRVVMEVVAMRGRSGALVLGAVAAAMALGGCSDDVGGGEPDVGSGAVAELDAYVDVIFPARSGPDPLMVRYEEVLAGCMAEAGFDYRPQTDLDITWSEARGFEGEFVDAEVYGYGEYLEGPNGEPPNAFQGGMGELTESQQANIDYVDSLSSDAQVEYSLAKSGDLSQYSEVYDQVMAGELEPDPSRWGCEGRASLEVYSDDGELPPELADVKDAVSTMWQRLQEDARVIERLPAWGACMEDAGYPAMTELVDAVNYAGSLWGPFQDEYANATPGGVGVGDYEVVKESIPDALHELQQAELDLAAADARCRVESGYVAAYNEVKEEIAQEILDTYRADLDAWVEWSKEQQRQ